MKQILLIGGSPRSGTTFIASSLNAHPKISLFSEFSLTDIYCSLDQMVGPATPSEVTSVRVGVPFTSPSAADYDGILRGIFRQVYPDKEASVIGTKMPATASKEDIDYLLQREPRLKVIYIFRNCRATVASSMRRYAATVAGKDHWLYQNETEALDEWVYSLLIGQYLAERADILYVKYEDFARDANEFARIRDFLGIEHIRFDVSLSQQPGACLNNALGSYPGELSDLVRDWNHLPANEIARRPLHAIRDHVAAGWQQMRITHCDIGTHTNFNKPEPWGAWSRPGFFALKPRFIRTDCPLRHVDLEFREGCERIERAAIRAYIGEKPASVRVAETSANTALVRVTSPLKNRADEDRPTISLFFDRWVRSGRDPRSLGLPLIRYRITYDCSTV